MDVADMVAGVVDTAVAGTVSIADRAEKADMVVDKLGRGCNFAMAESTRLMYYHDHTVCSMMYMSFS